LPPVRRRVIGQIGCGEAGFTLLDEGHRALGVGRFGFEQRALFDIAVDHFALRGPEPRQRALPRFERLEIEIFVGPSEADHEHDDLPADGRRAIVVVMKRQNRRARVALDQ